MVVNRRVKRVSEMLRQELGRIILSELHDPRIGFVTVTRVEVSPDLLEARAFVSVMGDDAAQRTALRGLNSARKRIRLRLGENASLRRVPELSFHPDAGVKRSLKISGLLDELAREREEAAAPSDSDAFEQT